MKKRTGRKKDKTLRTKIDRHYVSVYLSWHSARVWNLGLAVNKSKRASNDWYQARSNKRARKLEKDACPATPTGAIFAAARLMQEIIALAPSGDWIMVKPSDHRRNVIPRYMERFGFLQITLDGKPAWVVKAP